MPPRPTPTHDEEPQTSALLNAFLLLAFGWLLLATLAGGSSSSALASGVAAPPASTQQ